MYYILTHIHYYRCLKILHGKDPLSLIQRLAVLALQKGLQIVTEKDGMLLLSLDPRRERADSILLDTIALIEENMSVSAEWLNGYTILLEKLEQGSEEILLQNLRHFLYMTAFENKAWICPALTKEKVSEWKLSLTSHPVELRMGLIPISRKEDETLDQRASRCKIFTVLKTHWDRVKKEKTPIALIHPNTEELWIYLKGLLPPSIVPLIYESPHPFHDPLGHLLVPLLSESPDDVLIREDYAGDDCEQEMINAFVSYLENSHGKKQRRLLVFFRFSEWPQTFIRLWEKILRASGKLMRPLFIESTIPEKISLGEPLDFTAFDTSEVFGEGGLGDVIKSLDPLQKKILFLLALGSYLIDEKLVASFLVKNGEDQGIVQDKISRLALMGLFSPGPPLRVLKTQWRENLREMVYDDPEKLVRDFVLYVIQNIKPRNLYGTVLETCVLAGLGEVALDRLLTWTRALVTRNSTHFVTLIQNKKLTEFFESKHEWKIRWQTLGASLKLRYALEQPGRDWNMKIYENFSQKLPEGEFPDNNAEWVCHSGRLLLAIGDWEGGFTRVKKAYSLSQIHKDFETEIFSALEIGRILLRKKKIDEASEYFHMAYKAAEKRGFPLLHTQALVLAAIARYLSGNLHSCGELLLDARSVSKNYHQYSREKMIQFLLGRHAFEMGQYSIAEKYFQAITSDFSLISVSWAARSLAYAGSPELARKALEFPHPTLETEFFLAEALYLMGKKEEAAALALRWNTEVVHITLWRGLGWSWDSGFSNIEDLVVEDGKDISVLQRLSGAFRDFLLASSHSEHTDEATLRLEHLCTDKTLGSRDPHTHLYYLWLGLVIGEGQDTKNARWSTIMGRGLKELQTRGSHVDNRDSRVNYLNLPYWNAIFLTEAKKHKLL